MNQPGYCMSREPIRHGQSGSGDKGGWYCSLRPGHEGEHVGWRNHDRCEDDCHVWGDPVPTRT